MNSGEQKSFETFIGKLIKFKYNHKFHTISHDLNLKNWHKIN